MQTRASVSCDRKFFGYPSQGLQLLYAPGPRTFNLRVDLAHVDLLAAVLGALQGYRARVCVPLIACIPIRYVFPYLSAARG